MTNSKHEQLDNICRLMLVQRHQSALALLRANNILTISPKPTTITSTGPARCLQALLVVAAFLTVEVNVFFLKYALWVPPTNPLNTARLVLWLLVGAPAVREYYEFIEVRSWAAGLFPRTGQDRRACPEEDSTA